MLADYYNAPKGELLDSAKGVELDDQSAVEEAAPDRALPTWAIDSLLFGLNKYASAARIWGRFISVAMCAQYHGWTWIDFVNEVTKHERRKNGIGQQRITEHKLWTQLKACSRSEGHALQQLEKAWTQGIEHRTQMGFHTADDLINDAIEKAWAWEDRLFENKDGLNDAEMAVMSYIIIHVEKRRMSRIACSARGVAEFMNIPKSTAYRSLKTLSEKDFLVQISKGRWSKKPELRLAALYALSDPLSLRYGGRGAPRTKADVWKHFVVERDSEELVRARERGICVWGLGLGPVPPYLAPLPSGT